MKKLYSRRDMIREAAGGYGAVALSWMLQQQGAFAASTEPAKPKLYTLLPKQPHFPAKAKRAIFIYISAVTVVNCKLSYQGNPWGNTARHCHQPKRKS